MRANEKPPMPAAFFCLHSFKKGEEIPIKTGGWHFGLWENMHQTFILFTALKAYKQRFFAPTKFPNFSPTFPQQKKP